MINGSENNASKETRGLFTRFLNPIWQGLTYKSNAHNGVIGGVSDILKGALTDTENAKNQSFLESATGDFLDHWGESVGLFRKQDEDDETYRARIIKYIVVLRGTIPAIEDALKDYLGDDSASISIYEPYMDIFYLNRSLLNGIHKLQGEYYRYAVIDITIDRPFNYEEVMEIVDKFKPAGVVVYLTYDSTANGLADIITGFYDNLLVKRPTIEFQSFNGYTSKSRDTISLVSTSLMNLDRDIFILNKSALNSLDVLAGSPTHGRTSLHGAFMAEDITPTPSNSVVELIAMGAEVDETVYTATSFSGGGTVPIEFDGNNYMYQALDVFDYYAFTHGNSLLTEAKVRYIKVKIEDSPRGLDIGYLTALDKNGKDVAENGTWYMGKDNSPIVDQFDNGYNVINEQDRVSYATLDLHDNYQLKSIQFDNAYNGEVDGGIYVSEDGDEYQTVHYGRIDNAEYVLRSSTSLSTNSRYSPSDDLTEDASAIVEGLNTLAGTVVDNTFGGFLSGLYSNPQFLMYCRTNSHDATTTAEVFNFDMQKWETISSIRGNNVRFESNFPDDMRSHISDNGIIVTRFSTDIPTKTDLDYYSIAVTYHHGFTYSLNLRNSVAGLTTSREAESLLELTPDQEYLSVIKPALKTPVKVVSATIEELSPDPDAYRFFKMSSEDAETQEDEVRGFGRGVLRGANSGSTGEDTHMYLDVYRVGYNEPIQVEGVVNGSRCTFDLNGWYTDVYQIIIRADGYAIRGASIPKLTGGTYTLPIPEGNPTSLTEVTFFKDFHLQSKNGDREFMDDYESVEYFLTEDTTQESQKSLDWGTATLSVPQRGIAKATHSNWGTTVVSSANLVNLLQPNTTYRIQYTVELTTWDANGGAVVASATTHSALTLRSSAGVHTVMGTQGCANSTYWEARGAVGATAVHDAVFTTPNDLTGYDVRRYSVRRAGATGTAYTETATTSDVLLTKL